MDDANSVSAEQIVHVDIKGDWLLNQNARQMTFEQQNATKITKQFVIFIENYAQDIELTNDKRLILTYQHFDQQ